MRVKNDDLTFMCRILVKTEHGRDAAMEQLRDAGYDPLVGEHDRPVEHGFAIDFIAPRGEKLEFLRPHILPPLEATT
jgi:hypothetical protein